MDKNDLIKEIEMVERLEKVGIKELSKEDFIKSVILEDRTVGLIGTGDSIKVFCIGESAMESLDMNYKKLLDDHPDLTWRRQKTGDEMEIGPEKNTDLLEKYESGLTRRVGIEQKNTRKTDRSYKRLS